MSGTNLRQRIAELVEAASNGTVSRVDALAGDSLVVLGLDSLGLLRLVDAVELEYGVEVDLGSGHPLDTLDDIVVAVAATAADEVRPGAA